ncbi:MAG: hypothetical protein KDA77_02375 [Planctomycetaceae bacterium]|nr:hypothetical protein [Planctomycetaceae bacterium]
MYRTAHLNSLPVFISEWQSRFCRIGVDILFLKNGSEHFAAQGGTGLEIVERLLGWMAVTGGQAHRPAPTMVFGILLILVNGVGESRGCDELVLQTSIEQGTKFYEVLTNFDQASAKRCDKRGSHEQRFGTSC